MSAPSPRLQALLDGPSAWHTVRHVEEATSTNDLAADAGAEGTSPGLVVVADHQTQGRGRRGRTWEDRSDGTSLLLSALVPSPDRNVTLVPLAAGVAVADAMRRWDAPARLKWPNDVLLGDRKCGGILAERHQRGVTAPFVVVGIGLDVDWRGVERSGDAAGWTSLGEVLGREVDRWDLLTDILRALEAWLLDLQRAPDRLLVTYRSRCRTLGQQVVVGTPSGEVRGIAADIDSTGALVVDTADGRVTVTSGDVEHVTPV